MASLDLSAVGNPSALNETLIILAAGDHAAVILERNTSAFLAPERHARGTCGDELAVAKSAAFGSCRRANPRDGAVGGSKARAAGEALGIGCDRIREKRCDQVCD